LSARRNAFFRYTVSEILTFAKVVEVFAPEIEKMLLKLKKETKNSEKEKVKKMKFQNLRVMGLLKSFNSKEGSIRIRFWLRFLSK